jgi:hypothetical protein
MALQLTDKPPTDKPPIEQARPADHAMDHNHVTEQVEDEGHSWKHWGLMVLCCIPMIVVLLLVILGAWGAR